MISIAIVLLASGAPPSMNDLDGTELNMVYEYASGGAAKKLGDANVVLLCGLQSKQWHARVARRLRKHLHEAHAFMPRSFRADASQIDNSLIDAQRRYWLGSAKSKKIACDYLRTMPFVQSEAAFLP